MEGISYITDNQNRKKAIVIDLKAIEEHEEDVHDFIDTIIAESRKNDELIDWEQAKNALKTTVNYRIQFQPTEAPNFPLSYHRK